jgi:dimeric dUTPase (all-alpha-NTP-PPase superfamily)
MNANDLTQLYIIQEQLDEKIAVNHPIQPNEDRLKKINVALLVELGEAMNEYRKFKFWSTDQETRKKALLEELVDCLHFILSIGLRMRVSKMVMINPFIYEQDVEETYIRLSRIDWIYDYDRALDLFIGFCQLLGFNAYDLYNGYMVKNNINHKRQEQGY